MNKRKPQKGIHVFISDYSIPGGVRALLLTYIILAFYFFIVSILLYFFISLKQEEISFGLMLVSSYGFICSLFLFLSIYPLWSSRFAPKFWVILVSLLLVGYSFIWFFFQLQFAFVSLIFLLISVVGGLYVTTGSSAKDYYKKDLIGGSIPF